MQEGTGKQEQGGVLNEKLSKLLEKRKVQGAEAITALKATHTAKLEQREALYKEELNMKDTAHRRSEFTIMLTTSEHVKHQFCSKKVWGLVTWIKPKP